VATPLPCSRKKGLREQFRKKKKERGMATSILTVLPQGIGEMITYFSKRKKPPSSFPVLNRYWVMATPLPCLRYKGQID